MKSFECITYLKKCCDFIIWYNNTHKHTHDIHFTYIFLCPCKDVDECYEGTLPCSHDCINTEGSAFCVCGSGYELVNSTMCLGKMHGIVLLQDGTLLYE